MRRNFSLRLSVLLCGILIGSAAAQGPLPPGQAQDVSSLFASPTPDTLKCWLERWDPSLDFAFRFVAGYAANCRLSQFGGNETALTTYVRITPEGRPPVLLGSIDHIPAIDAQMREALGPKINNMKSEISVSGAFAVGEGRYAVELLVRDDHNRTFRRHWKLHAGIHRSERGVALAINRLRAESIEQKSWESVPPQRGSALRLSILLDAAPIYRYQSSLRAWDCAFLLQTLYSVLRQTPHSAVHLVAFNLDQQREVFRSDEFDSSAFLELSHALEHIELSSVSVKALTKRDSPGFLVALTDAELAANRSDAIIFLGPNTRMDTVVSKGALTRQTPNSPPIFYFEYVPWVGGFPDSIDWLVKSAGGRVFLVHTPAQFDDSIDKMLVQLKQQ